MSHQLEEKLFSKKSIQFTTYFLSPIVSGFMISSNFKKLGMKKESKLSLAFSFGVTLITFTLLFFIPENIIDKVPNVFFPLIYTGLIYLFIDKYQAEALEFHENNNGQFQSNWKVFAINIIPLIVILFIAFFAGDIMKTLENYDSAKYESKIEQYISNEEKSIEIINNIDTYTITQLATKIRQNEIYWNENASLISEIILIENLPEELLQQSKKLLKYSKLRIEENTQLKVWSINKYNFDNTRLDEIYAEIEELLATLE